MTVKERLEQYIKEDKIYQDFIDSKVRIKDLTDFDLYCINHCSDIEELLKENKELKKQLELSNELVAQGTLTEMKLRDEVNRWRKEYQDTYKDVRIEIKEYKTQQKEFIKYLEAEIENSTFLKPSLKMILQKYKEIIGDKENENND